MCPEPGKRGFWSHTPPRAELTNSRKQRQKAKNEKANRYDYPFFSSLLGVLIFVAYHWFGLSKIEVRQTIMKYIGLEQKANRTGASEIIEPPDKSPPKAGTPATMPSTQKKQ